MNNRNENFLIFFILIFAMACAPAQVSKSEDFSLYYYWNIGALPPEEHYEIELEVNPDRTATVTMQTGYENDGAQRTSFDFTVPEEQWVAFYDWLVENDIFNKDWENPGYAMVGAYETSVKIQANGSTYEIPSQSNMSKEDRALFTSIQAEIENLIPAEIWDKVEALKP
ncbi:MAG TPA: hypothetical protein DCK95_09885 [Anaerolineaceae bacterium]|nr:hypothetical protein [Anaerolineaceae bacterium]